MPNSQKDNTKQPVHPGSFLRDRVVTANNLSIKAAADVLMVSRPALSNLLNEHVRLSPEMATRIEKAFGIPLRELLEMQSTYDIWEAEQRSDQIQIAAFRTIP